jgi:hypothetical protein
MKKLIMTLMIATLVSIMPILASAGMVTQNEAFLVANNWIKYIIQKEGGWGTSPTANIDEIFEFQRGDRTLGYYCAVAPKGFVVISLLREFTPVKAYSATSDLDPYEDEGLADLLKGCMERLLDPVEDELGPLETVSQSSLDNMLGTRQYRAWEDIEHGVDMNYQEGDSLVDSNWHQGDPYNSFCPPPPGGDDCTEPHCTVGCVALAGSQIMHYWKWPPYGVSGIYADSYDWPNMPTEINGGSPQTQINAIAELCREVGVAVGMDYCAGDGCQSTAGTYEMEAVYETYYRYSTACNRIDRNTMNQEDWFYNVKYQINRNRPIQYRVVGHSIVCDGWREVGGTPIRQYHMNYGWANSATTWYALDSLIHGSYDGEYMMIDILPNVFLGATLAGTYNTSSFPYRYFDRDTQGAMATFNAGQLLQFLPGIKVSCAAGTGNYIRFIGTPAASIRMYTDGDISKGARLYGGGIKLHPGGNLIFH